MNSSRSPNSGFTLIELMLVVTIAGVLAALAMPSFTSLSQSQRVKNASFNFYSLLSIARSEAIKRNGDIKVTLVKSGSKLVSIDVASGVTVLHSRAMPSKSVIHTVNDEITYKRTGRTSAAGRPTYQIDVEGATISSPSTHARCITIGLSGVPTVQKGACPP